MLAGIGSVMQIAYVVEDLEQAIGHWNKLGAGPFFVLRRIQYAQQTYRGEHTNCEISAALGYFGDIQVELIKLLNDEPSSFKEFKEKHGFGMQHLGIVSNNLSVDVAEMELRGFKQIQRMVSAAGVETVLFDSDGDAGSVIEFIGESPIVRDGFRQMKAAAEAWNPSMPGFIEVE